MLKKFKKWLAPVAFFLLFKIPQLTLAQDIHSAISSGAIPIYGVGKAIAGLFSFRESIKQTVLEAILSVAQFIAWIMGAFFNIASWFLEFSLSLNNLILENNRVLDNGWLITRDVANLGFVIIIVVAAIATILRVSSYSYQKILPKLVAAAILVNFSLVIAGAFINFSHSLTDFFLEPTGGGLGTEGELTLAISGAFDAQKLILHDEDDIDLTEMDNAMGELTTTFIISMSNISFVIIFMGIATFTLLGMAIMFFIRYIYLTILLVLAPIVWLFWAFPNLAGQFTNWWKQFIKWVFFAPVTAFFIYLVLVSLESLKDRPIDASQYLEGGILLSIVNQGMQMTVIAALLVAGLLVAQKMSITGADIGIKWAKGAGKWTRQKMGSWTRRGFDRVATGGTDKTDKEGKTGKTRGQRLAGKFTGMPVVGGWAAGKIAGYSQQRQSELRSQSEKYHEQYKDFSNDELEKISKSKNVTISPPRMAAVSNLIAERNQWEKQTPENKKKGIKAIATTGTHEKLLAARPSEASNFGININDAIKKYVTDSTKLNDDQIEKPEVLAGMSRAQLLHFVNNSTDTKIMLIAKSIKKSLDAVIPKDAKEPNKSLINEIHQTKGGASQYITNLQNQQTNLVRQKNAAIERKDDPLMIAGIDKEIKGINDKFKRIGEELGDNKAILDRYLDGIKNPNMEAYMPQPEAQAGPEKEKKEHKTPDNERYKNSPSPGQSPDQSPHNED